MREPEFWNSHGAMAGLLRTALTPLGWAYGATVAYKFAHAKPYRSSVKVICVGNLSVGGTGKTPVSMTVVHALLERGARACILTRGYGGREQGPLMVSPEFHSALQVGDEALVLSAAAPVIVSRDRAAGAQLAERNGADVIVMDDGHQNFSLAKDLSLIVVDAVTGFGNGRVLPAGPLREPVDAGLARADAIVVLGDRPFQAPQFKRPTLRAEMAPVDSIGLAGARAVAFAGIGRPEKFFATVQGLGADVVEKLAFADHHNYTAAEIARLKASAHARNAVLVTTEKDFARLTPAERKDVRYLPVRAAFQHPEDLETLLDTVIPRR